MEKTNLSEIDITESKVRGNCDLKCNYTFKYKPSSCVVSNNLVMLSIAYDKHHYPPVIYNTTSYEVSRIAIVSPSYHKYDGKQTNAEMIIYHNPVLGGLNLNVYIPITISSNTDEASGILSKIIKDTANFASTTGKNTNVTIPNFTLNTLVPKKEFYSYTDPNSNSSCIVYSKKYSINISNSDATTLNQIIRPFKAIAYGDYLYKNTKGPNTALDEMEDKIYIKCNPTGPGSSDEIDPLTGKSTPSQEKSTQDSGSDGGIDFNEIKKSTPFKIVIVILCTLLLMIMLNIAYTYISGLGKS
jgi:hypothetical protein